MGKYSIVFAFLYVFFMKVSFVFTSEGDRSPFYQNCLKRCLAANCTQDGEKYTKETAIKVGSVIQLLWGCRDDCRYNCMWRTVGGFQERGYSMPKFNGKWPFARVLGLQEPGAALASLLNLAAHLYMWAQLAATFRIRDTPLVLFWHAFVAVCLNAWVWSFIFHSRDTPLTEFMDYASALSMVMALFVAAVMRVFHRRRRLSAAVLVAAALCFAQHARYLYSGRVDYDFNMQVNIFFGVVGSLVWLIWSVVQWVAGRRYVWRLVAFVVASAAALLLELGDFPPRYGWDAHALWHLSTVPLPLLFYGFVIDDLRHMRSKLQ